MRIAVRAVNIGVLTLGCAQARDLVRKMRKLSKRVVAIVARLYYSTIPAAFCKVD